MSRKHEEPDPLDEELTIPAIEIPRIEPLIRPDDAADLSSRDRRLVLAVSVMSQQLDFLIQAAVIANRHTRALERRLLKSEKWRRRVSGPLNVAVWLGTAAAPFVVQRLFFP